MDDRELEAVAGKIQNRLDTESAMQKRMREFYLPKLEDELRRSGFGSTDTVCKQAEDAKHASLLRNGDESIALTGTCFKICDAQGQVHIRHEGGEFVTALAMALDLSPRVKVDNLRGNTGAVRESTKVTVTIPAALLKGLGMPLPTLSHAERVAAKQDAELALA